METAAAIIWIIFLAIVLFAITPPVLYLCARLVIAARSIDRLFQESLRAAQGVADSTQHISALQDTMGTTGAMLQTASAIHEHSRTLERLLVDRLRGGR